MNPYADVPGFVFDSAESALNELLGRARWNGQQPLWDFLVGCAGAELADEWARRVEEFERLKDADPYAEAPDQLVEIWSRPQIERYVYGRHANNVFDELVALGGLVARVGKSKVSICDLGCGTGRRTSVIRFLTSGHVVGVDKSDRWGADAGSDRVQFRQIDIRKQEPDRRFDIVTAFSLYPYFDPREFWTIVKSWCCSGGYAFVTDVPGPDAFESSSCGLEGTMWPVAYAPTGGLNSEQGQESGRLLICRNTLAEGEEWYQCRQLTNAFYDRVREAEGFLDEGTVPYPQRTYSQYARHSR